MDGCGLLIMMMMIIININIKNKIKIKMIFIFEDDVQVRLNIIKIPEIVLMVGSTLMALLLQTKGIKTSKEAHTNFCNHVKPPFTLRT